MSSLVLPERWYDLDFHEGQARYEHDEVRFKCCSAGRRSGKSEIAKRHLSMSAAEFTAYPDGQFWYAAPTFDQVRAIAWEDLKQLSAPFWRKDPNETRMEVLLLNGATLKCVGTDKAVRREGGSVDGLIMDEYGDMKEDVWSRTFRPMLSTRNRLGWAWFIGKPRGRNHWWRLTKRAADPSTEGYAHYTWPSADIIDAQEVADARRDLDELSYKQEYEAEFVSFEGRCYYPFRQELHASEPVRDWYDPRAPLVVCFDFNVSPGVATVVQELRYRGARTDVDKVISCGVGEVWIKDNSNTEMVCRKLIADWGSHEGRVIAYGDPTGGNRGTAKLQGSDWDIVREVMRRHFKERFALRVDRHLHKERSRINATNRRLASADGTVRFMLDPRTCEHWIEDYEGVTLLEGSDGEIDKHSDPMLTHLSDSSGYYFERAFPVGGHVTRVEEL